MTEQHDRSTARRRPTQTRGVETRNAIVEAAAALFEEQGYDGTTTHQIAARAGVSVGALYRYFRDKEALLEEVYRLEIIGLRKRVLEEFRVVDVIGRELRELVRAALLLAFDLASERPGLRRVIGEQSRKLPSLAAIRREQEGQVHTAVRAILTAVPSVRVPDVEVGAYLVSLFMESLIDDYVLFRAEGERLEQDRVVAGAADLILRYLIRPE